MTRKQKGAPPKRAQTTTEPEERAEAEALPPVSEAELAARSAALDEVRVAGMEAALRRRAAETVETWEDCLAEEAHLAQAPNLEARARTLPERDRETLLELLDAVRVEDFGGEACVRAARRALNAARGGPLEPEGVCLWAWAGEALSHTATLAKMATAARAELAPLPAFDVEIAPTMKLRREVRERYGVVLDACIKALGAQASESPRETAGAVEAADGPPLKPKVGDHDKNFSWILAGDGKTYKFKPGRQRDSIKALYPAWKRGGDGTSVHVREIKGTLEEQIDRLKVGQVFEDSPARDTIVCPAEEKGYWALYLNAPRVPPKRKKSAKGRARAKGPR